MIKYLLSITLLFGALATSAQEAHYFRKDYSDYWLYYDNQSNELVPYLDPSDDVSIIHFILDLRSNSGRKFELCSSGQISVFINNNIVDSWSDGQCIIYETDSLYRTFLSDSIRFSIYKPDPSVGIQSSVLYPALGFVPPENVLMIREQSSLQNFVVMALLIIALVFIFSRESNPKFVDEFVDLTKTFALKVRASQLYSLKPYSQEVLSMLALQSLLISFFVVALSDSIPGLGDLLNTSELGFWGKLTNWLLYSTVAFMIFSLQYVLLSLVSIFFNNPKVLHVQFYDNLRINHMGFVVVLIVLAIGYALSDGLFGWLISILWILAIALFLLRSVLLYIKMLNQTTHRKIHIFSYFCATEILPVSLVVKLFF